MFNMSNSAVRRSKGWCALLHLHHWTEGEQPKNNMYGTIIFLCWLPCFPNRGNVCPTPCTPFRLRLCSGCIVVVWTYHVLHPDILFTTSYLHVCLQGAGTHLCPSTDLLCLGLLTSPSDDSFYLDSTLMPPHVQAEQIFFLVIVMSAALSL